MSTVLPAPGAPVSMYLFMGGLPGKTGMTGESNSALLSPQVGKVRCSGSRSLARPPVQNYFLSFLGFLVSFLRSMPLAIDASPFNNDYALPGARSCNPCAAHGQKLAKHPAMTAVFVLAVTADGQIRVVRKSGEEVQL